MLSVIDLIEAGTLTIPQTSWLLARILEGSSWMVGARPGGAGKTTIMSALLAMAPDKKNVNVTNPGNGWKSAAPGEYVVCYEISPGGYDGYIWGRDVARLAELAAAGVRVVTNLHADTLREAYSQIVEQCGVSSAHFNALGIFIPIVFHGRRRQVNLFKYYDGQAWRSIDRNATPIDEAENKISDFLARLTETSAMNIEDVRAEWLSFIGDDTSAFFAQI